MKDHHLFAESTVTRSRPRRRPFPAAMSESGSQVKVKKGGKKGRSDKAGANLGRAIIKQQFPSAQPIGPPPSNAIETERGKHKLRSVTQCDDLEELMSHAVLAGTDFTARRGELVYVGQEARTERPRVRAPADLTVPVPRRPTWHEGQSRDELDGNERRAFLEWRRHMADLEETQGYLLTPFEKNLEVWRQLWRVLERAQLIVQIVDARNPLLFRCAELERYVADLDPSKRCLLLINKADLLTDGQRAAWATYFRENRIEYVVWSDGRRLHHEAPPHPHSRARSLTLVVGTSSGRPPPRKPT